MTFKEANNRTCHQRAAARNRHDSSGRLIHELQTQLVLFRTSRSVEITNETDTSRSNVSSSTVERFHPVATEIFWSQSAKCCPGELNCSIESYSWSRTRPSLFEVRLGPTAVLGARVLLRRGRVRRRRPRRQTRAALIAGAAGGRAGATMRATIQRSKLCRSELLANDLMRGVRRSPTLRSSTLP
ncbi:hypothetical protein EVAR_79146_1 [Eumeta japonica]|uniref:Uncharacterized protein n=1 Tax=Eumeta variegata TaxID=151549 RepID=A0A4C1UU95_EUMVA|nr:hypothetical protein EVAR_79146_1 [Eumeta japonica]